MLTRTIAGGVALGISQWHDAFAAIANDFEPYGALESPTPTAYGFRPAWLLD